jgi:hypothetical protein
MGKNASVHKMWCDICKKKIRGGKVEKHTNMHLTRAEKYLKRKQKREEHDAPVRL